MEVITKAITLCVDIQKRETEILFPLIIQIKLSGNMYKNTLGPLKHPIVLL